MARWKRGGRPLRSTDQDQCAWGNRTVLTNSTESSVEEVFIEMRAQLTHIARRILRNPELAEEVVQDTYLRIAGGSRDRCVERPAAYCARAVRNMAFDYLRKQEHENDYRVHGLDVELLEVPSGSSPEGIVFERQAIQLIHKVLEGVSPRAREAFELYRVKGATQRQIAVQMGCALGVVNALIESPRLSWRPVGLSQATIMAV